MAVTVAGARQGAAPAAREKVTAKGPAGAARPFRASAPCDGAAKISLRSPRHGHVARGLRRANRLVRGQEVRRHSVGERDEVNGPGAAMVWPVTRRYAGDSELASDAVGHGVDGIEAPARNVTGVITVPTVAPSWKSKPFGVEAPAGQAVTAATAAAVRSSASRRLICCVSFRIGDAADARHRVLRERCAALTRCLNRALSAALPEA